MTNTYFKNFIVLCIIIFSGLSVKAQTFTISNGNNPICIGSNNIITLNAANYTGIITDGNYDVYWGTTNTLHPINITGGNGTVILNTVNLPAGVNTFTIVGTTAESGVFTINGLPNMPPTPTSNSPQCSNAGVTIGIGGSVPGNETWYWQNNANDTSKLMNAIINKVVNASGSVYINSKNNITGCWSSSNTIAVSTIPSPVASIAVNSSTQCLNGNQFIFDNLSNSNHPSWITGSKWYFGNGDSSENTFPNPVSYNSVGNYPVTLIISSTSGCTDTATTNLLVEGANIADFTVNNPGCGLLVNFNNNQSSGNFQWNFGDGNTSTQTNPNHTYASAGVYTVKLLSIGTGNCGNDSIIKLVNVGILPTAAFTNQTSSCSNKINFINNSTIASGTFNNFWNFGDNSAINNEFSPSKAYDSTKTYNVTLTVISNAGCSSVVSNPVNASAIGNGLNADFTYLEESATCINRVNFTNTTTSGVNYLWQFEDGSSSMTTNPTNTYANAGTYWVKLIASDIGGCTDTATKIITVLNNSGNAVKSAFTINNSNQCLSGNSFTFTNTAYTVNQGYGGTYKWFFGDGDSSFSTFIYNKKYNTPGTYNVQLISIANLNGCTDTSEMIVVVKPSPVANFTSTNNCSSSVTFTNNTTGAASNFWKFGDGVTSTNTSLTHIYASSGWYVATLIATGSNGCIDSLQKNIVTGSGSFPDASFTSNTNACNNKITFSTISTDTLLWDFGDGFIDISKNPTHGYTSDGAYTVTLIAFNTNCADTNTMVVNALAETLSPIADMVVSVSGCGNNLLVTNNSVNATNYLLYINGALVYNQSTATNYSEPNLLPGIYTISVVATNAGTCTDSISETILIKPNPTASFTAIGSNCGGKVTFNNTSKYGDNYLWNFGDTTFSNLKNPTKSYVVLGSYNVTLTVNNNYGCSKDTVIAVNVTGGATPPTASFTFSAEAGLCSNKINFNNTSTGSNLTYIWNFGDGNTSVQQNPKKGYAHNGSYNVSLIVINDVGCADATTSLVDVLPGNGPSASFFTDNTTQCITDNNYNFYNTSSYMNTTSSGWVNKYYWNFGDGTSDTTHTFYYGKVYSAPGTYQVRLVAQSTDGCRDTIIMNINIAAIPCTGVLNSRPITVKDDKNNNDVNNAHSSSTGLVNTKIQQGFTVYPNPNQGSFTIEMEQMVVNETAINITDLTGRLVFTKQVMFNNNTVNLSNLNLNTGQYIIMLFNNNNEIIGRKKIMITN